MLNGILTDSINCSCIIVIFFCLQLVSLKISCIVVVNDGSGSMSDGVFTEPAKLDGVNIMPRGYHQDKGVALRTGFRQILK